MKPSSAIRSIFTLLFLFALCFQAFSKGPNHRLKKLFGKRDGEEAVVNDILKKYFPSNSIAVSGLTSATDASGGKKLTGTVSFFGTPGVALECVITSDNKPKMLKAIFPASTAFRINHLDKITGGELRSILPAKFSTNAGVSIKDFTMTFDGTDLETFEANVQSDDWDFLDFGDFKMKAVRVKIEVKPKQNALGCAIKGNVSIGSVNIELGAVVAKNEPLLFTGKMGGNMKVGMKDIVYSMAGKDEGDKFFGLIPGDAFNSILIPELNFVCTPSDKKAGLTATSNEGNIEMNFLKKGERKEIRLVMYAKDLGRILPIDILKQIQLTDPLLVVSNMKSRDVALAASGANPASTVDIDEGVNVITSINLHEDIKRILATEKINLKGSIDNRKQVKLEGKQTMNVPLGNGGVKLTDLKFGIESNPAPKLFFNGTLLIPVSGQQALKFSAGLATAPIPPQLGGKVELLVEGGGDIWKNPFGIPGVGIQGLGGEVMLMPAPPFLSEVALKGGLLVGRDLSPAGNPIKGSLNMKLNVVNPMDSYLEASIENLTVTGMINAFTDTQLTGELANILNTGIEKGKIIINPKAGEVAASGDFKLLGMNANIAFSASKTGVSASGALDPWEIKSGNFTIFSLKGVGGNTRPGFSMAFGADPHFMLNGEATALESMKASANVVIRPSGFKIDLTGNIFNGAFEGTLHAYGRNLASTNPTIHADLKLSQNVVNDFKVSMTNFIKAQAGNSEESIRKASNSVNSGSREIDAVTKGFLEGVNQLQNGVATAGMLLVKEMIPDVRSITFSGDISNASTSMKMKIDVVVASQPMPFEIVMNLSGDYQQEVKRVAEEIAKQILTSFSYLGDQVKGLASQSLAVVEEIGKGVTIAAEAIGQAANDVMSEIDRFWNGENFEPARNSGPLSELTPDTRHYIITITNVQALAAEDDPIQGKAADVAKDISSTLVGVFDQKAGNDVKQALTYTDPLIEVYGAIIVNSDHSMRLSPNTNSYAWSLNRTRAQQNVRAGSYWDINSTKHFYAQNNTNHAITLSSRLKEFDDAENWTSDEQFLGGKNINLGSWNWIYGNTENGSFQATSNDGGKVSTLQVNYSITLEPKISAQQISQVVATRNVESVRQLVRRGADLREAGIMTPAIANRDISMINFLMASGTPITDQDVATALNPQFFDREIATRVLARSQINFNPDNLRQAVETGSTEVAAMLMGSPMGRGVVPDISHLNQALAKNNYLMAEMFLARGVKVGPNELAQAVNTSNLNAATLFMKYNARPDINMLNQAIQVNNKSMVGLLLSAQLPDQNSYQLAAEKNDLELFSMVGSKGVVLASETPSQRAIDFNNFDLLKMTFGYGASPTRAVQYAVQRENINAIGFCLANGADANPVISYAARTNNMNLFNALLSPYNANPTVALYESISVNNIEMAKAALATGNASPDTRLEEMANAGNEPMVRLLVSSGGNPDLAMMGSVNLQKVDLLAYLIQSGASATNQAFIQNAVNLESLPMTTLLVKAGANPDTGMPVAMTKNNFAIASFLLTEGASPNGYLAGPSSRGDVNMMKLLLDHGASANEGIASAVQANQVAAAKMLLEFGAATKGMLPGPSQAGNLDMVKLLLEFGANPNEGILASVKANKTDAAKLLLEAGASPNDLMPTASGFGNKVIVELLLDRGINANEGIRQAVGGNFTDVSLLLLDHGASIAGLIPVASGNGNAEIVTRLLKEGAVADEGIAAAVGNRYVAVAKILIDAGANVQSSNFMMTAVKNKQVEMVNMLYDSKCDYNYVDGGGNTFLHIVSDDDGLVALASAFIRFGVNLDAANNNGNTALHMAAESGRDNLDVVKVLVEAGADVNAVNKKGETPRKAAKGLKVKKYLKDQGGERKIKK